MAMLNRCCFCLDLVLGTKILAIFHILVEVLFMLLATFVVPKFMFAILPASCIGIVCATLLIIGAFKKMRWLLLPWLIYIMIIAVGFGIIAVLIVIIALGAKHDEQDVTAAVVACIGFLIATAIYIYFWIVVLEVFIRLGIQFVPVYGTPGAICGTSRDFATHQIPQQWHPGHLYRQVPTNTMPFHGNQFKGAQYMVNMEKSSKF